MLNNRSELEPVPTATAAAATTEAASAATTATAAAATTDSKYTEHREGRRPTLFNMMDPQEIQKRYKNRLSAPAAAPTSTPKQQP